MSESSKRNNRLWMNGRVSKDNLTFWSIANKICNCIDVGIITPRKIADNLRISITEASQLDCIASIRNAIEKGWNPNCDDQWIEAFSK